MAAGIRTATEDDAPRLVAVINRAFAVERFFVDRDRTTLEEIRRYLAAGTFLIIDGGEALVACVYIEQRGARAYIGMLSVDPERHGLGFGRQMMDAAERQAGSLGCRGIDIRVVNLRAELPPFYHARGYVETGTTPPVDDPSATRPYHFVLMSKDL